MPSLWGLQPMVTALPRELGDTLTPVWVSYVNYGEKPDWDQQVGHGEAVGDAGKSSPKTGAGRVGGK